MDMSYATIPIDGNLVKFYGERKMFHIIEDPNNAFYELLYRNVDVGDFVGYVDCKEHKIDECKYPE